MHRDDRNLKELSESGHFLKGSSATLGLTKMRNSCEKIQHLGLGKDETGSNDRDDDYCLDAIKSELVILRHEFRHCEVLLRKFYGEGDD